MTRFYLKEIYGITIILRYENTSQIPEMIAMEAKDGVHPFSIFKADVPYMFHLRASNVFQYLSGIS